MENETYNRHHSLAATSGIMLWLTLSIAYMSQCILFIAGIGVTAWAFPTAFLLAASGTRLWSKDTRQLLQAATVNITLITSFILFCSFIEDYSYDGNYYHQEIIARLLAGWNPFYGNPVDDTSLWVSHYAKGVEIVEADIAATCGMIEGGKAFNLILITATGLSGYAFLGRFEQLRPVKRRLPLLLLFTLNPVGVTQSFTFYIDYTKYYYLLLTLMLLYRLREEYTVRDLALLASVIILAIGTKFNIFFEEGVVLLLAIAWFFATGNRRLASRLVATGLVALILGACVAGYHPYVTNYLTRSHPLFPLMGEGAADIMSTNTPECFTDNSRVINFFISLFSVNAPTYDGRSGAFSPLMPLMLLLSGAMLIYYRKRMPSAIIYIAICTLVSCFFFEQSWWARYICQLWLIPPLAVMGVMLVSAAKCRIATWTIITCGLIAATAGLVRTVYPALANTVFRHCLYDRLEGKEVTTYNTTLQMIRHLDEHGINAVSKPVESMPPGSCHAYYYGSDDPDYFQMIEISPDDYNSMTYHPLAKSFNFNKRLYIATYNNGK